VCVSVFARACMCFDREKLDHDSVHVLLKLVAFDTNLGRTGSQHI
jgi:hypothetical protein